MYDLIFNAIQKSFTDKRELLLHLRFLNSLYIAFGIDYLLDALERYDVSVEDWDLICDFHFDK